ncbi:MAG: LCP family protein, partial [Rectinema sp.]
GNPTRMKPIAFDKSIILLLVIVLLFGGTVGFAVLSLRADEVGRAMKEDRIMNIAVIVEMGGKPVSTQVFMFYPSGGRGALLDVPGETGVILQRLKRMDRIDAVYAPGKPVAYVEELSAFLDTSIDGWIVLDEKGLVHAVDIMDGLELFIPAMVLQEGENPVRLPGGAVVLDGDKVLQYARYREDGENDSDVVARRHKLFQSLVKRMAEKGATLRRKDVFPSFSKTMKSNLSEEARIRLLSELSNLDADRLILQRITGNYRTVDNQTLLFPHYDGELVRDIVKQTLNALASSSQGPAGNKIFTVEILNGTANKGLASRTGEIFQSFGYEVVAVGNAEQDSQEKTLVLDRYGDSETLANIAAVIKCENTAQAPEVTEGVVADFTIILGKDFDGRYCAQ